jgi:hypothetical protein
MVATWLTELYLDQINRALLDASQDGTAAGTGGTQAVGDSTPSSAADPQDTLPKSKQPSVAELETRLMVRRAHSALRSQRMAHDGLYHPSC